MKNELTKLFDETCILKDLTNILMKSMENDDIKKSELYTLCELINNKIKTLSIRTEYICDSYIMPDDEIAADECLKMQSLESKY